MTKMYCPSCDQDVEPVLSEGYYHDWLRCPNLECRRALTCINPNNPKHLDVKR